MAVFSRTIPVFLAVLALAVTACGGAATAVPASTTAPLAAATLIPADSGKDSSMNIAVVFLDQPPDPLQAGWLALPTGLSETLFRLGTDFSPEPWLATGAQQVDEKTWEITIRPGVKFHNGAGMDAAAVKASLERAITQNKGMETLLDIASIEVMDPLKVRIVTNGASPVLPGLLTANKTAIVDAAAAQAMGDAFPIKPVLTGPYKVETFELDKEMVVTRHDQYWGSLPKLGRIKYLGLADANSRLLALQSGDVDIAVYLSPEGTSTVRNDPNLAVKSAAPNALTFMFVNHERGAMNDERVRQAVVLAIDRQALVGAITQGKGAEAIGPFPPGFLTCDQLRAHRFEPEKARALLSEAGYRDTDGDGIVEKDGQPLVLDLLTYRQRPELPLIAEAAQSMLKDIGIRAKVQLVEQPVPAANQGNWDLFTWYNGTTSTGDPFWALDRMYTTGGSGNRGHFSSSRVDDLAAQVGHAIDPAERQRLACEATQAIIDEVAIVPILFPNFNYGVSNDVFGFDEPHPVPMYFIDSNVGKR